MKLTLKKSDVIDDWSPRNSVEPGTVTYDEALDLAEQIEDMLGGGDDVPDIDGLRDKLNAALDDAEADGIELRVGMALFRQTTRDGRTCGGLLGCVLGDLPGMEFRNVMVREEAAERLGISDEEALALERGFENIEWERQLAPELYDLGVEFRKRAVNV